MFSLKVALCVQMRDLSGYIKSRREILDSKPNVRASWVAYATATYLAGEYAMAYTVIEKYFENLVGTNLESAEKYEESEFVLFQNRCLEKQGKFQEAIEHLDANSSKIVDKLSAAVKKAEFLVRVGKFAEAKEAWLALTLAQTENYRFHCGLQAAYLEIAPADCDAIFGLKRLDLPCTHWSLTPEQNATLRDVYAAHAALNSSRAVSKIRLSLVNTTEELRPLLDAHLRKGLSDGVPSLYHDVAFLVRQAEPLRPTVVSLVSEPVDFRAHPNTVLALEIVTGFVSQLRATGHYSAADAADNKPRENPAALLWTLYLHANLLERSGQLDEAQAVIHQCIEHTPTALDMHTRLGKLLRKSGDVVGAAAIMDNVRAMDLQDRYLNNKATKYLLRADNVPQAMDTIAMFTRHDGSDPQQTLTDLQCNWYELELAESYARSSKWGLALKKFYSVQKHFMDYVEDMFDFHSYAQARKVFSVEFIFLLVKLFVYAQTTLRMYTDALVMQDNVFCHPFYQRATRGALRIWLYLLDNPDDVDGLAHLPKEERKKERAKLKKKKAKEEKDREDAAKANNSSSSSSSSNAAAADDKDTKDKKVDPDPQGEKLLSRQPLEEAAIFCRHLHNRLEKCEPSTLALVAEVHLRRGKLVQASRVLHAGLSTHPSDPSLTVVLAKLYKRLRVQEGTPSSSSATPGLTEAVSATLGNELTELMGGCQDLQVFAAQYVELATVTLSSLPHRLCAARLLLLSATHKGAAGARTRAAELVADEAVWTGRGVTLDNLKSAIKVSILRKLCM